MQIFNGNAHAKELDNKIANFISSNKVDGKLAIIQIGANKSSEKYVLLKEKLATKLGLEIEVDRLKWSIESTPEVLTRGREIINSKETKSVIIQLPLPNPELDVLLNEIPIKKDIDMLSDKSKAKFYNSQETRHSPVIRAIEYFIDSNNLEIGNKKVLVVGEGELVGRPVAFYLKSLGANVEITENYKTGDKINYDLAILSVGSPNLVRGTDVSKGCHVIDFGSSIVNGKTTGDLDLKSKLNHLGIISPSPGGMGPLVIRFLLMNHLGI